jgi:glutamate synthase domain-containing protein 2/glutamate synthase domain-containing protein 3
VEPAEEIAQRFCTGAMSHGSISRENHEMLAIAMNELGGKSNTGEGGEDPERFTGFDEDRPDRSLARWHPEAGDDPNSAIKQVASGRFGVTPRYLAASDEVEIKMAQGSKPGEGGQIPGHKVSEEIAEIRGAVPGVPLISPPPHHDIYSIEDLAQVIHDLKRGTIDSRVAVKLVAEAGVGTVAAGVAKGYADTIQISGHDGGTGASPLSSIKHAGVAWELGLAETQRRLVENGLRGRVRLRADGGMKTGRDVVMAALFGAEEFGFGTASLVASGCVMTRQCHENTCPVGVATQDPDLRARFGGKPEHVVAFFLYLAKQVRMILAEMGYRRLDDVVGRVDLLQAREDADPPKTDDITLDAVLEPPEAPDDAARKSRQDRNDNPLAEPLADRVLGAGRRALETGEPVEETWSIGNPDRTIGARLGATVARHTDGEGLPAGTIDLTFRGSAGQSFGAFCESGMHLTLEGEAQDYVGKGMAGGTIAVVPPEDDPDRPPVLVGNTVLYGATGGALHAAGAAGERLCVRNSGAHAVVEGCGDHGCEYMTAGVAVVLGETGGNFGAGMHGGAAYVWDPDGTLDRRIHTSYVALEPVKADLDEDLLRSLVERHADVTDSTRAQRLLDRWDEALGEFRKVVPLEQRDCEADAAAADQVAREALDAVDAASRER